MSINQVSRDGNFLFAPLGPGDRPPGWVIPLRQGQEPFELAPELLDQIHYLSWSWDMRNIAFVAYPRGELYVMPFSPETGKVTGPAKKIMEGKDDKEGWTPPSWSPDGQQIAFSWGKGFDIWTIPSAGGDPKQITDDPAAEHAPIWLPDSKNILFCRNRDLGTWRSWDTFITPAEGGTAEKIIENAYSRCGVSANGKWFAFPQREGESGGFRKFGIVRLSDKHQIDIAIPKEVGDPIGWSGNKLLFCKRALEEWCGLSLVHAYGGPSVELGEGVNLDAWTQRWSPDGKTIIAGTFWIVPVDGGTPTKLELETEPKRRGIPEEPFSPDLKHYAFLDEERSLRIAPVSIEERRVTGPAVKITEKVARTGDVCRVSWSSDSEKIAFSSTRGGSADIWTASVDGSDLKQLTDEPGDERDPVWSPDGNMLAYDRESSVWVVPAAGGEPREIASKRSWTKPTWSPDGKAIAFIQDDQLCISIMELSTGNMRRIDNIPKESWSLAWSPDGGKLAFLSYVDGRSLLYVVPAVGGKPVELAIDDSGSKYDVYWSPDGRMLSFNSFKSVKVRTGSVWEADVSELLGE